MTQEVPFSVEAEKAVLASLLIAPDMFHEVADILEEGDFYRTQHNIIFSAMVELAGANQPADLVILCDLLDAQQNLSKLGGDAYLISLMQEVPTPIHAEHYAKIVHSHAVRRMLIKTAGNIAGMAYDETRDVGEIVPEALTEIAAIRTGRRTEAKTAQDTVDRYSKELQEWVDEGRKVWGIPVGLRDLDTELGGFHRKQLIIIAGRPGHGKSCLAMQMLAHAAAKGTAGLFISMEMGDTSLIERLACNYAKVDSRKLKNGTATREELVRVNRSLARIRNLPLYICDQGSLSSHQVTALVARHIARIGEAFGVVVIDHIQLASMKGNNLNEKWGEFTKDLKSLALRQNICVVALSQLNREVEKRNDKRPRLYDLRESGALEQNADVVLGLYCADAYEASDAKTNIAEIGILKARESKPNWMTKVVFVPEYTRFDDLAREKE